jgi:Ca2+-binding RTX toxin-like protein
MYRAPLRRLVPAITIIACLLAAPSAMAASATVDAGQDRLEYTASTGERNLLTVTGSSNTYTIEDAVSNISAGTGCTQLAAKRVRCSSVPSGPIKSIYLELRDQDDSVVNSAAIAVEVIAGEGADTLTGGTLTGDKLYGGLGDDLLDGGLGADFLSGDEGRDRVTYAMRTAPLNVNLATFWGGDGEVGEYDFIYTVEEVVGGSGDDRMTGSSGPNSFIGGPGNDILEGQDGNDALEGGAGADRLEGGNGDDALRSRDAVADTVNCGAGMDSMDVDAVDTVAADCERPATGPAAVPATLDRVPKSVRLTRKGYLRIKVTCPVAAVNGCKGTVTIAVLARSAGVTLSAATAAAGNKFSLKAGESKVTKVKISRNGRRRILRKKRANCKVSVHTSAGNKRVTVSKKITVKAPRKEQKSQ